MRRIDREVERQARSRPATEEEMRAAIRLMEQGQRLVALEVPEEPDPDLDGEEAWDKGYDEHVGPRFCRAQPALLDHPRPPRLLIRSGKGDKERTIHPPAPVHRTLEAYLEKRGTWPDEPVVAGELIKP